jgi:hypothetical protein
VPSPSISVRFAAVPLLLTSMALPAAAEDFKGDNCDLVSPPPEAGEIFVATSKPTIAGRVYPRLSAMPRDYTGCQVLWALINGERSRSLTLLDAGRVVAISPVGFEPLCQPGEKAADSGCISRKEAIQVSFPPGCAARTTNAKAIPGDCMAAFQAEFKLHDQIPQ